MNPPGPELISLILEKAVQAKSLRGKHCALSKETAPALNFEELKVPEAQDLEPGTQPQDLASCYAQP